LSTSELGTETAIEQKEVIDGTPQRKFHCRPGVRHCQLGPRAAGICPRSHLHRELQRRCDGGSHTRGALGFHNDYEKLGEIAGFRRHRSTGTHDNDTTLGWYHSLDEHTRQHVNHYLRITGEEAAQMPWPIIQAAMGSVSGLVVVPVQDLLGLGSDARFNTPGTIENNWIWQLPEHYQELVDIARLRETVQLYGR